MDNTNTILMTIFAALIIINIFVGNIYMNKNFIQINEKIDNIQPIHNQICEQLLPYGFGERHQFVCYRGEDVEYTKHEQFIINQWKNN